MTPEEYYQGEEEPEKKQGVQLKQVWAVFCQGFESEYGRKPVLKVDLFEETPSKIMELVEQGAQPSDIFACGAHNGKLLKSELLDELVFPTKKRK